MFAGIFRIFGDILAVQIKEVKAFQLLCRKLGDMSPWPKRMGSPHQHRIFFKKIHQLFKRQKAPPFLVGRKPPVQLQYGLQGTYGKYVSSLRYIRLHAGKNTQPFKQKSLSLPDGVFTNIAVYLLKAVGIKMLREAKGIQPGLLCLGKQPMGILLGKGQLFCKLSVCVKINIQ